MNPVQILQAIFGIFISILRFSGLLLSQIPGTKHVLKYLPWHKAEDFDEPCPDAWKKGRKTYKEMMEVYYTSPEYIEQDRRSRLTIRQRMVEDQFDYTLIPYKQPSYITLTVTFS